MTIANAAPAVVPVVVHGMTMAGIMGALTNMLIGGGMVALVRILPTLKQAANVRRKDDMDGLRDDIIAIKADAKEAKDEARRVSDIAQRLENMVACMRPAISILTAEVKRLDPNNPNNPALVQVQELMAMAASGDMGIGKAMTNIANIPAVGTP